METMLKRRVPQTLLSGLLVMLICISGMLDRPTLAQGLPPNDPTQNEPTPNEPTLLTAPDFIPIPSDVLEQPGDDIVLRERFVGINASTLDGETITLNLFDDLSLTAQKRSRQRSKEGLFWHGTVADADISSITITVDNGTVRGGLAVDGKFFTLLPAEGTVYKIREILQPMIQGDAGDTIPDDSIPVDEPEVLAQSLESPEAMQIAGAPQIDVVVLWTANARTQLASSTKSYTEIEDWINYAFLITNEAYSQSTSVDSQVDQRLRLVHAQEVAYTDNLTGAFSSTYLPDLNIGSDSGTGALAIAKNLEETYKADLIAIIVADNSNGAGIAYRPTSAGSFTIGPNESVTRWDAIFPNYTFSHELGHNMGLHHNRAIASNSWQDYGYGYQSPTSVFRTVMAYNCSPSCPRVGYFSNPGVSFGTPAEPMGVAIGLAEEAHNAQALIDSAYLISDNRASVYDIAMGDTFLSAGSSPDVFGEWDESAGNEACVADQQGNNDIAGIDDSTKHCVASNQVDQLYLLQAIDDVAISAGEATTACTLIDTDPDLFINYAICTTIVDGSGSPNSEAQTSKLYSCDNSSTSGCVSPSYVKDFDANLPTSGGFYTNGVFYFGNNESGPFGNDDSQLEIQVPYSDLGGLTGSATLCTKMSTFDNLTTIDGPPLDQVLIPNQYLEYDASTGSGAITIDGCGGVTLVEATLVSPINNVSTSTPDFVWNAATNATDYTVVVYDIDAAQIAHSGTFSASICSGGVCTAQPGWTLPAGDYRWLVRPEENGLLLDWVTYAGP